MGKNTEENEAKLRHVREELKLKVLTAITTFKSDDVPDFGKLKDKDIIHVLSSIITRRTI
jgi:hypothetical protein